MLMDTNTAIPATMGQVWVASAYVRLVAGTTTNFVAISIVQYFNDLAGTLLTTSGNNADAASLPTNAPLRTQRYACSSSPTNANTAFTSGCGLRLNVSTSQSYDFTLRVGAPQTELLNTTNLMPLIGGGWSCSNAIATSWQPDPVGTSRAVFVTDNATVTIHYYSGTSGTIPNNQPITCSVYMRDGGRRYLSLPGI